MNGILFKPEMIQAIIEGRKTQTRRIMKPQPYEYKGVPVWAFNKGKLATRAYWKDHSRYQIGQKLYIKEAHRYIQGNGDPNDFGVEFKDGKINWWRDNAGIMNYPIDTKWRSPMFLKEIYARYFIEITGVEPQRLQEITEADARAEGFSALSLIQSAVVMYQRLWNTINEPPYDWASNCWVWKYTFKQVK